MLLPGIIQSVLLTDKILANVFLPNPRQQQAIAHVAGPMLVLAGAGTGKTSVLVERIARLIEQGHARPDEVLAITFTENAAKEMKERVEKRLKRKAAINAATFNAYCQSVLTRNERDFHVLPPEDVYVFLRQRVDQLQLQRFIKPADVGEFLTDLRNFFDRCHEELIEPEDVEAWVAGLAAEQGIPRNCRSKEVEIIGPEEILARWREIARTYTNSMRMLEEQKLGTFGMQISRAVRLLRADAGLLAQERARARFILIDEFQDCNSGNIILADLLAGDEKNIFAVGDPDQAIYRFRGASSAAFEEFQRRFPGTAGVILDENQRSRGNILKVAFSAIDANPRVRSASPISFERVALQSGRDRRDQEEGRLVFDEPVSVEICQTDAEEAACFAEQIDSVRKSTSDASQPVSMAVLYRSHSNREKVMEQLAARNIPFIVKGLDVMEAGVIRDLLAAAGAVCNESDAGSLFRMCAFPRFAVSAAELRAGLAAAGRDGTFKAVMTAMPPGERVLTEVRAAREFIGRQGLRASIALAYLAKQFDFDAGDSALQALFRFVGDWEKKPYLENRTLQAFLGYLDLYADAGGTIPLLSEDQVTEAALQNPDAVQLMTVHGAKGLEFTHVWLLRVQSQSFPLNFRETLFEFPASLRSSVAVGESKEVNEQEERRLFYVAITRARDRLTIGARAGRGKDATPSGFLRPLLQSRALSAVLQKSDSHSQYRLQPLRTEPSPIASWMLLPPAFKTEDMAFSANSVENYSLCPMKFKLGRDWLVPGETAAALHYGSAVHTVLKNYYDPQSGLPEMSADEVVEAFRREFNKAVIEDPVQRRLYEDQGERQLRELVRTRPRSSVDVLATEASFSFAMGPLKVRGRIDRIDRVDGNVVRVVDYKTGSPRNSKQADDSLQLSIYAMGAAELSYRPQALVLLNVNGNEEVTTSRSPAQLEKARFRIEEAARGIAAGEFGPRPGMHCRWCDFERLCPATEQRVLVPIEIKKEVGA